MGLHGCIVPGVFGVAGGWRGPQRPRASEAALGSEQFDRFESGPSRPPSRDLGERAPCNEVRLRSVALPDANDQRLRICSGSAGNTRDFLYSPSRSPRLAYNFIPSGRSGRGPGTACPSCSISDAANAARVRAEAPRPQAATRTNQPTNAEPTRTCRRRKDTAGRKPGSARSS